MDGVAVFGRSRNPCSICALFAPDVGSAGREKRDQGILKMRFGLSIPFRTLLNLESEITAIHRADAARVIADSFRHLKEDDAVENVSSLDAGYDSGKMGIMTLSQDAMPWFSQPVLTFSLVPSFIAECLKDFAGEELSDAEAALLNSVDLKALVEVYDNTIGVVSAIGSLDIALTPETWGVSEFETFLSSIGQCLVMPLNSRFIAPGLKTLNENSPHWQHEIHIVRPQGKFQIFFDLNKHPFPEWDDKRSSFFWAHRVYVPSDIDVSDARLRSLLRMDEIELHGIRHEGGAICHVGSSLVADATDLDGFLKASSLAQYFYCLLDVLNDNQNMVYRELSAAGAKKDINRLVPRFYRMENFVDYVFNEALDTELSLQSLRRRYFESLKAVFGTELLVEALRSRDRLVRARMERKSFDIARTDRKLLQFALFVLGAAQVLNLILDIFGYVKPPGDTAFPGLIDLFRWLDVNLTFNIVSLVVITGALLASFRRK